MQAFNQYFDQQAKLLIKKVNTLRSRDRRRHVFRSAVLTIYGFQVAIPTMLGLFLGCFLDKHFPVSHISWVLNMVLLGALIGFYNANVWFYRAMEIQAKQDKKGGKK